MRQNIEIYQYLMIKNNMILFDNTLANIKIIILHHHYNHVYVKVLFRERKSAKNIF